MPTIFIGKWIRGAGRFLRMGTTALTKGSEEQRRETILRFWRTYGLAATKDAYRVSQSTLYDWHIRQNKGCLAPGSRKPKHYRRSEYSYELVDKIRAIRGIYGYGKTKLKELLSRDEGIEVSESTIGRIIKKYKLPKPPKKTKAKRSREPITRLRKPKDFKPKDPGELVGLDTIVLNYFGFRFYVIVAIDWYSRVAIARCYSSPSSKNAADLLHRMQLVLGVQVRAVNTDNGSEFLKNFITACDNMDITHYFNYPRCPKMNAITERFNRTLQEDTTWPELSESLSDYNQALSRFIFTYNFYRPHYSLSNQTPVQVFLAKHSSMYWTHTGAFFFIYGEYKIDFSILSIRLFLD